MIHSITSVHGESFKILDTGYNFFIFIKYNYIYIYIYIFIHFITFYTSDVIILTLLANTGKYLDLITILIIINI